MSTRSGMATRPRPSSLFASQSDAQAFCFLPSAFCLLISNGHLSSLYHADARDRTLPGEPPACGPCALVGCEVTDATFLNSWRSRDRAG
jgi:hypothetical protein